MGCDIHLHFEKKNKDGNWEKIDIPKNLIPDDRNYDVFGRLAGVRSNEFYPLFEGRGIPKDSNAFIEFEDREYHNETYFYLDEIKETDWELFTDDGYELSESYFIIFLIYILPRLCFGSSICSTEEKRSIRCVMAFDS